MNKRESVDLRPYTGTFFRGNRLRFTFLLFEMVLNTFTNLLLTWVIKEILDVMAGEEHAISLQGLVVVSFGILILIAVCDMMQYFLKPAFVEKAMAQYKNMIFEKLTKKGIAAFSRENTSLYLSALSNDLQTIETGYLTAVFELILSGMLFAAALTMMFVYSPLLTVISILLSLLPVLMSMVTARKAAPYEQRVSEKNEAYMATLGECLSGFSVIRAFRAEKQACSLFARQVKEVREARSRRKKITILIEMFSEISGILVQVGVLLIGAFLAANGRAVTVGVVMAFVQFLAFVLIPIKSFPELFSQRKAAKALIGKIAENLERQSVEEGGLEVNELKQGITVKHLSFSYEEGNHTLSELNVSFEKGKSYAIVGASGSGKSTLLNLLLSAHQEYQGEILYDGYSLREIKSSSLYELVSVIEQKVFIFNATIRENITMFSSFSDEEVNRAIQLSGLTEVIREKGEDYLCGENGSGLSGGEKQRISVARSLLRKSSVLLVDEATAALDQQTALQVSEAILHLKNVTRIVVTHALEERLLSKYDRILTMKAGRVIEEGTFRELMDRKGYFYSLYTVSQ